MTSNRFARLKELLLKAADLPESEREAYLEDACRDDPELRREIEKILAHEDDPTGILKTGAVAPKAIAPTQGLIADHDHPARIPERIAGYRIVRKLGEGGMGVVYEAEQQSPRRLVALKIIRGGAYIDEQQIRLFHREAQALARLKHPDIAAIYESGRTDAGQHFFAMELVRGVPLDEHLKRYPIDATNMKADVRSRLELFLQICDAISYAHQRGVIHRDLKPGNIMILSGSGGARPGSGSDQPQVKILDFGLARMTDADVAVATIATEVGKIQGTLAYMSPEQARGNPDEIDLRSDVYSLGVILYEILTEALPYDVRRPMIHEAVRVICEEEPAQPSTIVRALRGDLETIALKALEKEQGRRYQSASALGEDVGRYLANEPILARPPSATYQFRKLVARHKAPFAFVGTLFVLLVAFGITMSIMFGQQRAERLRADAERQKAEQTNTFLQEMLSSADPMQARGQELTVREVLDAAADRVEALSDQPEVEAATRLTVGRTYRALGLYDEAEPHVRAAVSMLEGVHGSDHREVAVARNELGNLLRMQGKYAEAVTLLRETLAAGRKHGDDDVICTSLTGLGLTLRIRGDHAEAEALLREAISVSHALGSEQRALGMSNLARVLNDQGNYAEAESLLRGALETRTTAFVGDHPDIARGLSHLAAILAVRGRQEAADSLHREAVAMSERLYGEDHPYFALSLASFASHLGRRGRYAEAESLQSEVLSIYRHVYDGDHTLVAKSINNLGLTLKRQGRYAAAEPYYREALAMNRRLLGDGSPNTATVLGNLAVVLRRQKKYEEAEILYRESLQMRRKLHGDTHPEVATALTNLGVLLREQGRYEEAEETQREALATDRRVHGDEHPGVATCMGNLASVLRAKGSYAEAESLYQEALAMRRRLLGDRHPAVAYSLLGLGVTLLDLGELESAEPFLRECLEIRRAAFSDESSTTLATSLVLSECLVELGAYAEAESLLLQDLRTIETSSKLTPKHRRDSLEGVVSLYETWGKEEEAARYRAALADLDGEQSPPSASAEHR